MLAGYRTRLLSDLQGWTDEGLISAEAAAIIRGRHPARNDGVLVAMTYVAGILLGAGLIALIASNWQDIPRPVRVGGLLVLNLAIVAACALLSQRKPPGSIAIEALAALSIIISGASISLVGQMYHFPANWPAFGRSMIVIAIATAIVARSTSALWLGAAALVWLIQSLGLPLFGVAAIDWPPHSAEIGLYSVALIGIALSPWTARVGPWTLLVVLLPGLSWMVLGPTWNLSGISLAALPLISIATLLLVRLGPSILPPQRVGDALSALLGTLVIVIALLAATDSFPAGVGLNGHKGSWLDSPAVMVVGAAAGLLLIDVRPHADLWSGPRFWLALALMACCGIGFGVPLKGNLAVLGWLAPLAALAVEARLSDRNKTFAAVVVVFLALIVFQMGVVKDLRTFAAVLLAAGVIAIVILLAVRKSAGVLAARSPG